MKTNIKMRVTPEQSKKVQEICFENGITWNGLKEFDHLRKPFLYIYEFKIGYDCKESQDYFNNHHNEEIDANLFIRTNGACEEKKENNFNNIEDLKTIVVLTANKHDILEQKLKKKNEILKKARIKRKNQREELHKLNLKLQKCISLEEYNLKMKTVLNEKHYLEVENKSLKDSSKISCNMLHKQKDKIDEIELDYIKMNSNYKKEIENLKAVIEYLEKKVK